jgi:MFS family permease
LTTGRRITPLIARITHKMAPIRSIAIGGLFYALAFGMFGFLKLFPTFLVFMVLLTFGEILVNINASTFIVGHSPASHRGRISSILPMVSGSGYALGPVVMGMIVRNFSIPIGWFVVGGLGIFSATMMFLLGRMERK